MVKPQSSPQASQRRALLLFSPEGQAGAVTQVHRSLLLSLNKLNIISKRKHLNPRCGEREGRIVGRFQSLLHSELLHFQSRGAGGVWLLFSMGTLGSVTRKAIWILCHGSHRVWGGLTSPVVCLNASA